MSDLYIVLRSRLDEVAADWVQLGTETMKNARTARGLSMEAAARKLHVSTKTYDRREKDGRWHRHDLPKLADVLGLEIESPAREKLVLDSTPEDRSTLETLRLTALSQEAASAALVDAGERMIVAADRLIEAADRLESSAAHIQRGRARRA